MPQVRAAVFAALTWEAIPSTPAMVGFCRCFYSLPQLVAGHSRQPYIAGLSVFWPGLMLACFLACAIYIRTLSACS